MQDRIPPEFQKIDLYLDGLQYLLVKLVRDSNAAMGEHILPHHLLQTSALLPCKHLSEMVQLTRHQRVQNMVILQEINTILHEIVDELAKHNLLSYPGLEFPHQLPIDLADRLLSQEDAEISLSYGQASFIVLAA